MPAPLNLPAAPAAPAIAVNTESSPQAAALSTEAMNFVTELEDHAESVDAACAPERFGSETAAALFDAVASRCEQWIELPSAHHARGLTVPLGPQPTAAGVSSCIEIIEGEGSPTLKQRAVAA